MAKRLLEKKKLLEIMRRISNPRNYNLTQDELERDIEDLCAGCPNPVLVYSLIAESQELLSDDEIISRALEMAYVSIEDVPFSIIPAGHYSRIYAD